MRKNIFLFAIILLFPLTLFAQDSLIGTKDIILSFYEIVNTLTPIAFVSALLFFFWGVAKYIRSEGQGKSEGKNVMVWGVVALFVISSVWGLVWFLRDELTIGGDSKITIPTAKTSSSSDFSGDEFQDVRP